MIPCWCEYCIPRAMDTSDLFLRNKFLLHEVCHVSMRSSRVSVSRSRTAVGLQVGFWVSLAEGSRVGYKVGFRDVSFELVQSTYIMYCCGLSTFDVHSLHQTSRLGLSSNQM
jgi:hypothetical protein